MNTKNLIALAACTLFAAAAQAQETKVTIAISGWTGFAPLTLAKEAGIYKKHGLDAYFRPSRTAFQADRGRHFSVIADGVSD